MKFAQRLAAHITPEWNSQYIKYDELKEFLYHYEQNAPIQDDEHLLQRYYARADEQFFQFCDKELAKINIFFAEKLAEAQRKFENLKNELKESTEGGKSDWKKSKQSQRSKSLVAELVEDDQEEEELSKLSKKLAAKDGRDDDDDKTSRAGLGQKFSALTSMLSDANTGAQTFTQRIMEKNRERQMKQKQYRKEHDLKLAFSEFYLALILLQNYQTLNFTGFRKILKKHDKIFKTDRGADWHKNYVETAPFNTTKKVDSLIADVENLFTQRLEHGDRQRAMKRLRVPPFEEKQSPWTTFRLGLFIGMVAVLVPALIATSFLAIKNSELSYDWKVALKLYRSSLLVILHIFFIGLNSYGWSRSGVNHVLIFEIDPRNHLSYQQLLEAGTFLSLFWFVSTMAFMINAYYGIEHYIYPLSLVGFLLVYLIQPIRKFHYSSRKWLMNILWKVFTAPFHHVGFADFWLADQLTSFDFLFTDIEFFGCWFLMQARWAPLKGFFPASPCMPASYKNLEHPFNTISLLLMCFPAWIRFLQCCRRYRDTGNVFPHIANAAKYSTTFFDIGALALRYHFSYMYETDWHNPFFYVWLIIKIAATFYKLYWDYRMDWGFFDENAGENKYLREVIVYSSKNYYYFAIVQNFIIRFIWLVRLYDMDLKGETYKDVVVTFLGFLEVFRRFIWNFFRLENEHLNNCGQFRAVRDISISPIQVTDLALIEKMMDDEDGVENRNHTKHHSNVDHHTHNPNLTITRRFINKHPNLMNITKRLNMQSSSLPIA